MRGAIDDNALVQAVRKRLLRELEAQHQASISNTINNNQGGGSGHHGGGLVEAMNGGLDPESLNYLVDIEKKDDIDPVTGKSRGWSKKVRRFTEPRGK